MRLSRPTWIILIIFVIILAIIPAIAQTTQLLPQNNPDYGETDLFELTLENVIFNQVEANQPYESDIFSTPSNFNALVVEWTVSENLFLEMRVSENGNWLEWEPLLTNEDNVDLDQEILTASNMHFFSGDEAVLNQVQFRTWIPVQIPEMRISLIDSTAGPDMAEVQAAQEAFFRDGLEGIGEFFLAEDRDLINPKPDVISREIWCTDDLCSFEEGNSGNSCIDRDTLRYVDVSNLIVHHTVTANDRTDWPGVVRAVWKFHAFSRCWGDIGYNYLIDPNGNIYEGHRGGDNVMGTHAAEMNAASMGVALLGTFTTSSGGIDPPQPMLDSLVDILSWKAEKEGIDPFDSTYVPIVRGGRPNIMGHRDAFGTTECPGQRAHAMLPEIRDDVGDRLGIENRLIYVDELIDQFVLSNSPNWREGRYNCGWDQHAYYTFSTTDVAQAVYYGEWTIDVPQDGRYQVEAMIPFCNTGRGETSSAFYTLTHDKGSTLIKTDMQANVGLWADLGEFDFRGDEDYLLRLTDLTEDNGLGVWFDAIRLTPITVSSLPEPKVEVSGPDAGNIVSGEDVVFSWEVEDFYNPESIELTFSAATTTTITATQVITSIVLPTDTVSTTWSFDDSYDPLYWQVFANGAKIGVSEIQTVTIDALPPVTQIDDLILLNNGEYHITWSGEDDLSGVDSYLFQYQIESSEWITITETFEETQLRFTPPDPEATYGFRVRAVDQVGNIEEFRELENSVSSVDAIKFGNDTFLPAISRDENEIATPQR